MFRALSTRRASYGYDKLGDESRSDECGSLLDPQLTRARSVPAQLFGFPKKSVQEPSLPPTNAPPKSSKKSKTKSHPVFSLFGGRWRKKMTAKPEFARYMEYLKEGGRWDKDNNKPVFERLEMGINIKGKELMMFMVVLSKSKNWGKWMVTNEAITGKGSLKVTLESSFVFHKKPNSFLHPISTHMILWIISPTPFMSMRKKKSPLKEIM
ncbi:hypothetical protein V2J09_021835 [Rumex salicifolius]